MNGRPIDDAAVRLDSWLREIRQALRRTIEAEYAKGGLTGPQRSVMQALFQSDGMTLSELCRSVGLAHSTVSGIVDRLEKRGMIERRVDDADRRFVRLLVGRTVRDFMRDVAPSLERDPLVRALQAATEEERESILRGVETLHRLLINTAKGLP